MSKLLGANELISLIEKDADIIISLGTSEPVLLLNMLEDNYTKLHNVKVHQMLAIRTRDYILGEMKAHLSHVSYFLSGATRKAYHESKIELVPNNFHEVPGILKKNTKMSMIMTVVSPMDEHGYFSLGTQADYISEFIGVVPFVVEVNKHMPRTYGENQIHSSQIAGFVEYHAPLFEQKAPLIEEKDLKIAQFVTNEINDGDTLQIGIGAIPNAVMGMLKNHKHLGIHTEMLTDSIVELVKAGAIDGTRKFTQKGKIVASFALGTKPLYDFIHENPSVEFLPVSIVNDPRNLSFEKNLVSINATIEADLYGQCASETIGSYYYSSTGGQADFARGVRFAEYGKGFVCMHATAKNDTISRIKNHLSPGSVVTTTKNDVDHIVTEYGIAKLHGKSLANRAKSLIQIAHPAFREELLFDAKKNGILI